MFDPNAYREICSELRLSEEKLQEVIHMTEQTSRKTGRRPLRVGLIAAALCALLAVSVSAANPQVLEGLVATIRSSFTVGEYREELVMEDGVQLTALRLPEVTAEERDGRSVLTVDGLEMDITDAMARDGTYTWTYEDEGAKVSVQVYLDEQGALQTITNVAPAEGTWEMGASLVGECSEETPGGVTGER